MCKENGRGGTVTTDEVETAISDSLREIGIERIKDKQKEAILTFVSGRDTFVVLPTGYGKPDSTRTD